jgi:ADP-heptose:LPS heptosyltransferase
MRILVIRLSAMGDVALTIPVLRSMSSKYPDNDVIMLTRKGFAPFFYSISGLTLFHPDLRGRHSGFFGIFRLYSDIISQWKIDHVIDIHDVLRTKLLRFFFRLKGVPVSVIDKGRIEKRKVISGKEKKQLAHSIERYCKTFADAGFEIDPLINRPVRVPVAAENKAAQILNDTALLNIGVAPFAKHSLKMWPEENMKELLNMISAKRPSRFWLFGGPEEKEKLDSFSIGVPGSENIAGSFTLEQELAFIGRLDFMIAMDSSNMHMAALSGTKVISIWGGTDPLTGFGAWMQPDNYAIRIPVGELTCRPCTIYGKGKCKRGDFACMNWLTPELVFEKIERTGVLNT